MSLKKCNLLLIITFLLATAVGCASEQAAPVATAPVATPAIAQTEPARVPPWAANFPASSTRT